MALTIVAAVAATVIVNRTLAPLTIVAGVHLERAQLERRRECDWFSGMLSTSVPARCLRQVAIDAVVDLAVEAHLPLVEPDGPAAQASGSPPCCG